MNGCHGNEYGFRSYISIGSDWLASGWLTGLSYDSWLVVLDLLLETHIFFSPKHIHTDSSSDLEN